MGIVRGAIVRREDDNCPGVIFRGATVLGGNCSWGGGGASVLFSLWWTSLCFGNVVRLQSLNRLKVFARESSGFFITNTV